jgi:hypothetical protein
MLCWVQTKNTGRNLILLLCGSVCSLHGQGWTAKVKVKRYTAGECQYIDLEIDNNGKKSTLKRLKGEVVLAEKANRIIVISTCPEESSEWLYFFLPNGKRIKRIPMNYGGIYGYEYDEGKQQLRIKYGRYDLNTRSMEEKVDVFDMNGNLIK